jgi:hypothetical protein
MPYLFMYFNQQPNINYKVSMSKEGNKQTHTHKQGNLCDFDNNENSIKANLPTIML